MRAIIVDDEPVMTRYFARECESIPEINLVGSFTTAGDVLLYATENPIDVAFLDVEMPQMSGLELAGQLRALRSDMLIVFVSAYDYVWDSNKIGADYYLVKPYDHEMMQLMVERLVLIAKRQKKNIYIKMFGTFSVSQNGKPLPLTGKAKEILAFLAMYRGEEVSNSRIYSTLWEEHTCGNGDMTTYFHALRRLKSVLANNGLSDLIISNTQGQMINTDLIDCDYYSWMDKNSEQHERFRGIFLPEYSWGEETLAEMVNEEYGFED